MKVNVPDFDVDASGISDSFSSLNREFAQTSARLARGATAQQRNIEAERKLREGTAIRGTAGRLLLGGVAVGSKTATLNNQAAVNSRVEQAEMSMRQAMFNFTAMNSQEKAEFLNNGNFEKINDELLKFLDDDIYGVDTQGIKSRWLAGFSDNYNRIQLKMLETLRKEAKDKVGERRSEFRNRLLANPYHPDATNGKLASEFRNGINGLVESQEDADSYQMFDQIYGLLYGFYNFKDYESMTSLLDTDEAKQVLGDDYGKFVLLRNKLKDRAEKAGDTSSFKITEVGGAFSRLANNLDIDSFVSTMNHQNAGGLAQGFVKSLRHYVSTAEPLKNDKIDLSKLHKHIPKTANPTQQAKLHESIRASAEAIQKAFSIDPVDVYLRATTEDGNPYLPPKERGLIFENTGRILTNQEATLEVTKLISAFNENFETFANAQQDMVGRLGSDAMIEVYALMDDAIKGSSAQRKNYVKIIQLQSVPEVAGQLPLPEAREAVSNGIGVPTSNNMQGLGDAVNKSWSNNKALMDVISIIAHARTLEDPVIKRGEGLETGDFALKYWENFNALVDDYDSQFRNVTENFGPDDEGKGLNGTHLQHRIAAGKAIDPDGYVDSIREFENNMNRGYFRQYGSKIFSSATNELLDREDVTVEANLIDGNYEFHLSVPRGGDAPPISYPIEKMNGEHFKLPVQIMYRSKGKIFQNTPYFDEVAFTPKKLNIIEGEDLPAPPIKGVPDNVSEWFRKTKVGKRVADNNVLSHLTRETRDHSLTVPPNIMNRLMLKLMYRESRFDPNAVEKGNISGRARGKGILQLTSPHLTRGIDPSDVQQSIKVGIREIDRLYKEGLTMAKAYNAKREKEGDEPLDFTHGDIMMYAIKAWNGGGVDSPKGFNMDTIVRAFEGRLSDATGPNEFASSILYNLTDLSPEEEAQVNRKEQDSFFDLFGPGSPETREWMNSPITETQRGVSIQRSPDGTLPPATIDRIDRNVDKYVLPKVKEKSKRMQELIDKSNRGETLTPEEMEELAGPRVERTPASEDFEKRFLGTFDQLVDAVSESERPLLDKKYRAFFGVKVGKGPSKTFYGPAPYTTDPRDEAKVQPELFKRAKEALNRAIEKKKKNKDTKKEKEEVKAIIKEAGVQAPFLIGAMLNFVFFTSFTSMFRKKDRGAKTYNYANWLKANGLPPDTPYRKAWEWYNEKKRGGR